MHKLELVEAKTLLKVSQKLEQHIKEFKRMTLLPNSSPATCMEISDLPNLKRLKLKDCLLEEHELMDILKAINKKKIKIHHLDLSGNTISSFMCKEISLIC